VSGHSASVSRSGNLNRGLPLNVDTLGDKRTVMNYMITPIEKSWKTAFWKK
jgi:hypothetical protein